MGHPSLLLRARHAVSILSMSADTAVSRCTCHLSAQNWVFDPCVLSMVISAPGCGLHRLVPCLTALCCSAVCICDAAADTCCRKRLRKRARAEVGDSGAGPSEDGENADPNASRQRRQAGRLGDTPADGPSSAGLCCRCQISSAGCMHRIPCACICSASPFPLPSKQPRILLFPLSSLS